MIRIDSKKHVGLIEVTGNPVDVSMFFAVWQQASWPEFFKHRAESPGDEFIRQMRDVNQSIKDGKPILLANNQSLLSKATEYAVGFCSQFIQIERDE